MNELLLTRIDILQNELERLKKMIIDRSTGKKKQYKSLYGIWKNVEITEDDIKAAKQSLFGKY